MKIKTFFILFFVTTICNSQTIIEGFIFDIKSKESLPFATIKIISKNNYYTITNEDGKFEISDRFTNDSIEVRFLGFKTKKTPISYFNDNKTLYLTPNATPLKTVLVVAKKKKDYTYQLFYSLIQKYRSKNTIIRSKAFLTLTSSARGIPIEIVEGFYNCEQTLAKGIVDLNIKSGRFGQNKSFPFYSLNNTDILKDFQLFKKGHQILPLYPGNLNLSTIKSKYLVTIDECKSCQKNDLSISFVPKKNNGRFFSGTIIFNQESLTIKKIKLECHEPITNGLTSIIKSDEITPKEIKLIINFNPIDFEKIQSVDFKFSMIYKSQSNMEIIQSNSFIYFYDYNNSFIPPYFTNSIKLKNDYAKIIALQSSQEFWNSNYQFPKSFNEKYAINYFKESGYLINYNNDLPLDYIKYIRPAVIPWNKEKLLDWKNIKYSLKIDKKESNADHNSYKQGATKEVDNESFSISDLRQTKAHSKDLESYNFSYVLDITTSNDTILYNTKTLFDRNNSFCIEDRTQNKLTYINMIFNIYEIYNKKLKKQFSNNLNIEDAKKLSNQLFEEATTTVNKMKLETELGTQFQNLIRWNEKINKKLNP